MERRERNIAVEDLFAGYFETVLAKNELIAALRIPAQGKTRAAYMKVTTGSVGGLAGARRRGRDRSGRRGGQVGARRGQRRDREGVRLAGAEKVLAGATVDDKTLARAGDAAAAEAECISDVRGSAAYKRELVRVYVGRAVRQALRQSARSDERSDPLMATTTMQDGKVGAQVGARGRCANRAVAAAARGAREGHRARRIHPHHAATRHAVRKDLPQHGRPRPHQVDRRERGEDGARRASRGHLRGRAQGHPRALLRAGLPRPADPGDRQGALCRRAGRGRARRRSACRRGGGAADRRRIRGAPGGVRRGRGRRQQDPRARRSSSPRARSPTSSTSRAARAPISRSITGCAAATSTRPSPRPRTYSSTPSARRNACISRSSPTRRSAIGGRPASPSTAPRRVRHSCAPRSRACSAGRRTASASRYPISAAASAASSTSSSKRW